MPKDYNFNTLSVFYQSFGRETGFGSGEYVRFSLETIAKCQDKHRKNNGLGWIMTKLVFFSFFFFGGHKAPLVEKAPSAPSQPCQLKITARASIAVK